MLAKVVHGLELLSLSVGQKEEPKPHNVLPRDV